VSTSRVSAPILLLLLLVGTSGCALFKNTQSDEPAPSRGRQSVELSRECEHLARIVNDPAIPEQPDPWLLVAQYAVALGNANAIITAQFQCHVRERQGLAKRK
jgi:hypothetical protein